MKAKPFTIKILKVGGQKASEFRTTTGIILQRQVKDIEGLEILSSSLEKSLIGVARLGLTLLQG